MTIVFLVPMILSLLCLFDVDKACGGLSLEGKTVGMSKVYFLLSVRHFWILLLN